MPNNKPIQSDDELELAIFNAIDKNISFIKFADEEGGHINLVDVVYAVEQLIKAYSLQERINELNSIVLNWDGLSLYSIDRRITDLEKELEALK